MDKVVLFVVTVKLGLEIHSLIPLYNVRQLKLFALLLRACRHLHFRDILAQLRAFYTPGYSCDSVFPLLSKYGLHAFVNAMEFVSNDTKITAANALYKATACDVTCGVLVEQFDGELASYSLVCVPFTYSTTSFPCPQECRFVLYLGKAPYIYSGTTCSTPCTDG